MEPAPADADGRMGLKFEALIVLRSFMKLLATLAVLLTLIHVTSAQDMSKEPSKRYTKVPDGYLMVLRMGDSVFDELEKFAKQEKIPAANFTGMGFADVTFGFFDSKTKEYTPKEFQKVELASMHGTIAWKDGKPSIHSHGVCGDQSFQAHAGHILSATVSTGSLEIMIVVHDKTLQRKKDELIGADVLQID